MKYSFENIVGQNRLKSELDFRLGVYEKDDYFRNTFLGGSAGGGKTYCSKELARAIHEIDKRLGRVCPKTGKAGRKYVKLNCSSIKNQKEFFENFIMQNVEGQRVFIHMDEAHDLDKKITNALLTILEPTPSRKTSYPYFDYNFEFDHNQMWMFTTTEEQKMFPPLMTRLHQMQLDDYTNAELEKIVQKGCPDVKFDEGVLSKIVKYIRHEGRAAHLVGDDIRSVIKCKRNDRFTDDDFRKVRDALNWLPFGITESELKLLEVAASYPEDVTLQILANRVNKSPSATRVMERYLVRIGYYMIDQTRHVTKEGREFLETLKKSKK